MAYDLINLIIHGAIIGLVIGIIELYFVHADEDSFGFKVWWSHGWHALPWTIGATIFNLVGYYSYQTIAPYLPIQVPNFVIPIIVFLVSLIKIHAKTAIMKGLGEKWIHCTIVAALIGLAPFIYPFIAPYLPSF